MKIWYIDNKGKKQVIGEGLEITINDYDRHISFEIEADIGITISKSEIKEIIIGGLISHARE
jgi:hypothetical protein